MVKKKASATPGGIGKSLMRSRFKNDKAKRDGEGWLHTADINDGYDWGKGMKSVTETGDLEEFLATAELTGREFAGEKLNVKVITDVEIQGAVLSEKRAKEVAEAQNQNKSVLKVPRRPKWDAHTTKEELLLAERAAFVEWRRDLASVQDNDKLLLTPFEKNLEVWRQLWRVIERSDVVVQIVDARNPLLFRSEDLVTYVKDLDHKKKNLLLINKSDMLSHEQRLSWAKYLRANNIDYAFWSANPEALSEYEAELLEEEARLREETASAHPPPKDITEERADQIKDDELDGGEYDGEEDDNWQDVDGQEEGEEEEDDQEVLEAERLLALRRRLGDEDGTYILNASDLLLLFRDLLPKETLIDRAGRPRKPTLGLVGYPNVGKSSTINALCGEIKVKVSATPGKTRHFQTIMLEENLLLCDCPGLVFPTFMSTKAEMVCNGILPIDQLRDPIAPSSLVALRIPRPILESAYGMHIIKPSEEEDPNRPPTGHELLHAFGRARGFMTAHGLPDVQKSGRVVLKDYVKGKLLYCHPPPGESDLTFNAHIYDNLVATATSDKGILSSNNMNLYSTVGQSKGHREHGREIDEDFFNNDKKTVRILAKGVHGQVLSKLVPTGTEEFDRVKFFPHQSQDGEAVELDELGRPLGKPWKKHNKKGKREKVRRIMDA